MDCLECNLRDSIANKNGFVQLHLRWFLWITIVHHRLSNHLLSCKRDLDVRDMDWLEWNLRHSIPHKKCLV